jgi:hypothetical protein
MNPEELFLQYSGVIDKLSADIARRHHLDAVDSETFASHVKLLLIDHDYEVIRKFNGRCWFRTYLIVVIFGLFKRYRGQKWGEWPVN